MEDLPIRAIIIGVSVFIAMITMSLVMSYYNSAKNIADVVSERQDIAKPIDDIVTSEWITEKTVNGIELRSLIRKYAKNEKVKINLIGVEDNINNSDNWVGADGIINEALFNKINPAWTNKITKTSNAGIITLKVELNKK